MTFLNVEPSVQEKDLSNKVIGIYGPTGVGKSTLASMFDGVFFAATEAGLSHLSNIYKANITKWEDFIKLCNEFTTTKHKFKTLCVDTFDNLCHICTDFVCKDLQIDDISDYKKYGAYHIVTAELQRVITKLSLSNYGLILTSHVKEEEHESKTKKWNKATVSIGGKNKDILLNICDPLLYMSSEMQGDKEVGIIQTKPSMYWEAKDKAKLLPDRIEYPLKDLKVAYDKIIECYK